MQTTTFPKPNNFERLIKRLEVESRTGHSRSQIYELMRRGEFPKPVRLGTKSVAWVEHEIDGYIAARIAERDTGSAAQ